MAQTTPNFGFNIAEGTDTVNLLTQCYPNFTSLDSILQGVKETGITTSVATKTGTNFAVVRTDTDCNVFRFVATANYAAGDTFTVDGVAVTATSPAGTALPAGAFVINQSVLAILNSSVLTVFAGGAAGNIDAEDVDYDNSGSGLTATDVQAAIDEVAGDIPTGFAATAITYDNTGSGLTATQVQDAIDEVVGKLPGGQSVSVTADGVKTFAQLLNALSALIDYSKVSDKTVLVYHQTDVSRELYFKITKKYAAQLEFVLVDNTNSGIAFDTLTVAAASTFYHATIANAGPTYSDNGSGVVTSGRILEVVY